MSDLFFKTDNYISELQKQVPSFNVKYKDESIFMKILGAILFFNPKFMTDFVTTIGSTVYLPNRQYVQTQNHAFTIAVAHEYVHARDSQAKGKLLFKLMYLFPQILMPLLFVLGFLWHPLFWISLFFLLPSPAYFRAQFEKSGYIMSMYVENQIMQALGIKEEDRRTYLLGSASDNNVFFKNFTYYVMWIFGFKKDFNDVVDRILSGDIEKDSPYFNEVKAALNNSKG